MGDENGPDYRGELERVHYFVAHCGVCERWEQPHGETQRAVSTVLRSWGWRLTKYDGWVCPECRRQTAAASA